MYKCFRFFAERVSASWTNELRKIGKAVTTVSDNWHQMESAFKSKQYVFAVKVIIDEFLRHTPVNRVVRVNNELFPDAIIYMNFTGSFQENDISLSELSDKMVSEMRLLISRTHYKLLTYMWFFENHVAKGVNEWPSG